MKVVCAGNQKTGTKSIAKALRLLGFTVYDWEEQVFDFLDHWVDVFQTGTKPDVKRVYEKADAVVDMPGTFFFEEILEAFPECKVILNERDEESWIESFVHNRQVVEATETKLKRLSPTLMKVVYVYKSYHNALYGSHNSKSTYLFRKGFRIHNDRVRSVVPPEKLLIYNVKQGWKPLCDFLGCEIPNLEFPHENIRAEIVNKIINQTRLGYQVKREYRQNLLIICTVLILLVAMIVFIAYKPYSD